MRRKRQRKVKAHAEENRPVHATPATDRMQGAIEAAVAELDPVRLMDARCLGVAAVSFWEGGGLPKDDYSLHFLISPSLNPKEVAPYLRALADTLEARR
jgi:hypothetical protein